MKIRQLYRAARDNPRLFGFWLAALAAVCWLLLYKLGSLTGGLSRAELAAASAPVGLHGIYDQPFDLPLKLVRSVVFFAFSDHGQTLTRLPNALFGGLAITTFGGLIYLWHGKRTAVLATAMFATSAWVLHASRLASFDVMYLWTLPTLLFSHFLLRKYYKNPLVWYVGIIVWGLLLYIPGLVWFVAADIFLQRKLVLGSWRYVKSWWQRILYVLAGLIWPPLLIIDLTKPGNAMTWLGLPAHFAALASLLKQFAAVPVHLFIRGPQYPELWLAKTPILDVFALVTCVLGIYFYATHWQAARSRLLAVFLVLGLVLVGLGGPVSLSLLVPLLYMAAATGLAYLLLEWLKIFPNNPLARGLGVGLVVFAVSLSCLYNYRAYFIAWPHTAITKATFQYHRQP
jgi:hypothetical protein